MRETFEIVPVSEVDPSALADAIGEAFGKTRTLDWFRWKHIESPWGPSTGWVAVDDDGVLGLRMFTPWRLTVDGSEQTMQRAMDGAVVPRARRRGIFQSLVSCQMDADDSRTPQLLFSTAVPASQAAYEKLGWTVLPRVEHRFVATLPAAVGGFVDAEVADLLPPEPALVGTSTRWDTAALLWRTDERSGHLYRAASLSDGDQANGIIWRDEHHGPVRSVVEVLSWGSSRDRGRLRRGACWRSRTPVRLEVVGNGRGLGMRRGGSTVAIWSANTEAARDRWRTAADGDGWTFAFADVEGVM